MKRDPQTGRIVKESYCERYPTGRKHCATCKRWRHCATDFTVHEWADIERTYPRRLHATCKYCIAERNRRDRGHKPRNWYPMGSPHAPGYIERRAKYRRELYKRLRQDPEWVKKRRRYNREYSRARRAGEVAGIDPRVTREPFDMWLRMLPMTTLEIARATGLDESFLRKQRDTIPISVVDKVCITLGYPEAVAILYGS